MPLRSATFLAVLALAGCNTSPYSSLTARRTSAATGLDKSGYLYDPKDRSCDGFPRLQVETMPGTCLGLVLAQNKAVSAEKPWKMPRTIAPIPNTPDFLVTDMGGWAQNKGGLYWLRRQSDGQYENILVKGDLNMPHEVKGGPHGFFYLGETDKIVRFHFSEGKVRDWEVVVDKLPHFKGHMHPLVALAFDPRNGDMYINSGAPSDHCFVKNHGTYSDCPEESEMGFAAVYRVPGAKLKSIPPGGLRNYEVAAQGLRNSMAMEVHPTGMLVQGENSRDFPQLEEPYEEMNAIDLADDQRGRHYGWPYCFNFHGVSPEWKFPQNANDPLHKRFNAPVNCAASTVNGSGTYRSPHILMPPHSAPLHLVYYPAEGQLAAQLKNKLLVSWHGYQPPGHRIVGYKVDERGLPLTSLATGKETYSFNVKGGCPVQKPYKAEGGMDRVAEYTEVIAGWNDIKGVRPKGTPVGFTVAGDGSLFVVEDKNRVIVRLAHSDLALPSACESKDKPNTIDPRIELLAWRNLHQNNPASRAAYQTMRDGVLKKYCASCHGGFQEKEIASDGYSELDYLVKNEFFVPRNSLASKLYQSLAHTGEVPAMPPADIAFPDGPEGAALVQSAKTWIDTLPGGIEKAIKKTAMTASRRIRSIPSAKGKECGLVGPGDVIYVDPQASYKAEGWSWTRVYMLPSDSRLYKTACPYPIDGTFYIAVTKL